MLFSNNMQNVSFKGNFIKQVNIKKLSSNGQYKPFKANFIELNHDDITTLQILLKKWENSGAKMNFFLQTNQLLPPNILNDKMNDFLYLTKGLKKEEILPFLSSKILGKHLYAVTKQNNNFKNLNIDDILGLVDFEAKKKNNEIAQLHVRPDCISEEYDNQGLLYLKNKIYKLLGINIKKEKRQYSHIGEAIITTLQSMYNDKPMELISLRPARNFYKKYGFFYNLLSDLEYTWHPKNNYSKQK